MNIPKGKLIAIGGAEDKGTQPEPNFIQKNNLHFFELGILKRFVQEIGGENAIIEVITTASVIPEEVGNNYMNAFGKLGCTNVNIMHIKNREDVLIPEYIERIKNAEGIMFTGGNQLRLSTIFGGTEILRILQERYWNEDGFVIAGTSAGAMAMSNPMIYLGSSAEAHLKGSVKITTGFGFIQDVVIDSHFEKRGRFGRLAQAIVSNPTSLGIGLGEDTGVVITNGDHMEIIGSGPVVILDGHNILHSNIADIPLGTPIAMQGMTVHFLAKGNCFEIRERKYSYVAPVIPVPLVAEDDDE
ncbi:MAG: cyanophycinase [Sphingobacteriales bacterium]|nr:MAG: cyanophycinase [Sphingobacteriales bacterium]